MDKLLIEQLGPLAHLVGIWEGDKGDDIAPSDDRGLENNKYRERITFEQMGPVQNHEQNLHVLRYSTKAWRIGEDNAFHKKLEYWSWEPATQEIMRCFLIPRGIALIAGGKSVPQAKEFTLAAQCNNDTFGICVNPFLLREFKILSYEVTVKIHSADSFSYKQNTVLKLPGRDTPFDHKNQNTLFKVK
jgi:hypothetical protein